MMKHPSDLAVLTTDAMARADRFAVERGVSGETLMEAAGRACAEAIMDRWAPRPAAVLCGPGNNGGDGWVIARLLKAEGWPVTVFAMTQRDALTGDAAAMAARWTGEVRDLAAFDPARFGLAVDALFGAGLSRPLEGDAARAAALCADAAIPLMAVDVPSGLHGDRARADGPAFSADLTVTFHALKPAHLLWPARGACGRIALADIGIPEGWQAEAQPCAAINDPALWPDLPPPEPGDTHKHRRGRLCVLAGGAGATGAARLAAAAGLKAGAGFVTLLCPPSSLMEAAIASLAVVTKKIARDQDFGETLSAARAQAAVLGPGAGTGQGTRDRVLQALVAGIPLVLDADALTVFEDDPDTLFAALHGTCVLTPHEGEFERLFPGLLKSSLNRIEAVRAAAGRAGAVVVLKGPATVIASPSGEARINVHASPRLATAGTGDVLAGLIGALLARGADAVDAACAAVWLHSDAGRAMGAGETAEDLLARLPGAFRRLSAARGRAAALERLAAPPRR